MNEIIANRGLVDTSGKSLVSDEKREQAKTVIELFHELQEDNARLRAALEFNFKSAAAIVDAMVKAELKRLSKTQTTEMNHENDTDEDKRQDSSGGDHQERG